MLPKNPVNIDLTANLNALRDGSRETVDDFIPLVYNELHKQAHRYLRGERANHTLQTTALINEAYLRLVEQKNIQWENRAHFFGMAANMMRRILVDYARSKYRVKRGGKDEELPLEEALSVAVDSTSEANKIDLILLDETLDKLALKDAQEARIVELRYFSGLSIEETAQVLGISEMTVKRDWNVAKAWLRREMTLQIKPDGK